jgi:hypothetical protein
LARDQLAWQDAAVDRADCTWCRNIPHFFVDFSFGAFQSPKYLRHL